MGLPNVEELDHCPISPECAAKKLFRTDGKLFRYDTRTNKFVEHTCNTAGIESVLPNIIYVGEWLNKRTGRIRYHGPFRAKSSARKPPPDGGSSRRRRPAESEWELKKVHHTIPDWKVVEE